MGMQIRAIAVFLILGGIALAAGSAPAGSWTVRCAIGDPEVEVLFEHYDDSSSGDYGTVPEWAALTVGKVSQELRAPTQRAAGLLIYEFEKYTVVYSGTAAADAAKHIAVYDKTGGFSATGACTD